MSNPRNEPFLYICLMVHKPISPNGSLNMTMVNDKGLAILMNVAMAVERPLVSETRGL
jgi:hypothetical protein